MDTVFENPYVTETPEDKPWTKMQIVAATTFAFTTACLASVAFDKTLEKLFKL
jgi:hypothetical protein